MDDELTDQDIGQHYLKIQTLDVSVEQEGKMLRRFVEAFANMHASEEGTMIFGVVTDSKEEEEGEYQDESV